MEVISQNVWYLIGIIVLSLGLGFMIGRWGLKRRTDGWIIVDLVEDEDESHEKITWQLGMDLDAIKTRTQIVFRVKDRTSQKSQPV